MINQTPVLNSLTPDIASPQKPGVTITWTAGATDADNDTLFFRFFLNPPATNGSGSQRRIGTPQHLDLEDDRW